MKQEKYYVRMKIDNYLLDRYGYEAQIHATIEDGIDTYYALLLESEKRNEDDGFYINKKFTSFKDAHDYLVDEIKEVLTPIMKARIWKGRQSTEDLEELSNNFNL